MVKEVEHDEDGNPVDYHGNPYPTDWFDEDDLDGRGQLSDEFGDFSPYAGNREPVEGRCNEPLAHWPSRYGERRYCGQYPKGCKHFGQYECDCEGRCSNHVDRANIHMRAKELFQHGASTKTPEHFYDKCDPRVKLCIYALYESLLEDSVYYDDFAIEYDETEINFSEVAEDPDDHVADVIDSELDEEDVLTVEVPRATEKIHREKALWLAAVDVTKMMKVNGTITAEDMTSVSTEFAQLTAPPSEHDPSPQEFETVEERNEHYLNLAYSRLVKDHKDLLAFGGVQTGTEADFEDNSAVLEDRDFLTVEADPTSVEENSGMLDVEPEANLDDEPDS